VEDRGLKTHHGHVSSDILIRGVNPNHTITMDYQDLMQVKQTILTIHIWLCGQDYLLSYRFMLI